MEDSKKIEISGTANRYAFKKLINNNNEKVIKKRIVTKNWNFENECYEYTYQIKNLTNILNKENQNEVSKKIIQEINKKIYNYKQQDILKKILNEEKFITFENVISKLVEAQLKCRYCDCEMLVLYDISREMKQWSVDRIDNDNGHNNDNFHLACLDCNLKRRRRTDESFLFTKQLNIIKQDN